MLALFLSSQRGACRMRCVATDGKSLSLWCWPESRSHRGHCGRRAVCWEPARKRGMPIQPRSERQRQRKPQGRTSLGAAWRGVSCELAWLRRTQAKCPRDCHTPLSGRGDATARREKGKLVRCDAKGSAESRCSGVGSMRILFGVGLARSRAQHGLAYLMGQSRCGSSSGKAERRCVGRRAAFRAHHPDRVKFRRVLFCAFMLLRV